MLNGVVVMFLEPEYPPRVGSDVTDIFGIQTEIGVKPMSAQLSR